MMKKFKYLLLAVTFLAVMSACRKEPAPHADEPENGESSQFNLNPLDEKTRTKILFIGNSHDLDATWFLPDMLLKEDIRNIEMTRVYHGAYYLVGYDSNYTLSNNCSVQTWAPGQTTWRGSIKQNRSLRDVVESDVYDIVILQEYTGSSHCFNGWTQQERDAIMGLMEKIRRTSPKAEFVYFLSHCWADGYSGTQTYFGGSSVTQFNMCVENNLRHVMDMNEGFGIKKFISTAAMLENLRTSGLNVSNGNDLLRGDGVHLDYGMSRCAAGLLLWKTLITPLTGIQPEDVRFRYSEFYTQATKYGTPFTDDNRATVLAAVNAAYEHPDRITDLSAYSTVPSYVHMPGTYGVDMENVDVQPVTFPVEFPVGNKPGTGYLCNSETQVYWPSYGRLMASQQQATAKWVNVSMPVKGLAHNRTFTATGYTCSFDIKGIWTDDYMEFIIPVVNFRAGTTVQISAPIYMAKSPVFWYLEYKDGDEWVCSHSDMTRGKFTRDASFALDYGSNAFSRNVTFTHGIDCGFMRMRMRCADGSVIATAADTYESVTAPHVSGGNFDANFYIEGLSSIKIDIVGE